MVMSAQNVGDSEQTVWLLWVSGCFPNKRQNTDPTCKGIIEMITQNDVYESALPISMCTANRLTSLTLVQSEGGVFMPYLCNQDPASDA